MTDDAAHAHSKDFAEIKQRLAEIELRNSRVDADKRWETSIFRRALVCAITYLVTACVFYVIGVGEYLVSACIPTTGYLLSTLTLPAVKRWWIARTILRN